MKSIAIKKSEEMMDKNIGVYLPSILKLRSIKRKEIKLCGFWYGLLILVKGEG